MNNKAQSTVMPIVALIVGVGMAVLILIFVGALGGQTYNLVEDDINEIANNSVVNESITPINNTLAYFAHQDIQTGTLTIKNGSTSLGLGNFTLDYDAGSYKLLNGDFNNTALNASYTWGRSEIRDDIKDSIVSSFDALNQTGDYLPIIVLAVIITLILGLVLGFAGMGRSRGSSGAL